MTVQFYFFQSYLPFLIFFNNKLSLALKKITATEKFSHNFDLCINITHKILIVLMTGLEMKHDKMMPFDIINS